MISFQKMVQWYTFDELSHFPSANVTIFVKRMNLVELLEVWSLKLESGEDLSFLHFETSARVNSWDFFYGPHMHRRNAYQKKKKSISEMKSWIFYHLSKFMILTLLCSLKNLLLCR